MGCAKEVSVGHRHTISHLPPKSHVRDETSSLAGPLSNSQAREITIKTCKQAKDFSDEVR